MIVARVADCCTCHRAGLHCSVCTAEWPDDHLKWHEFAPSPLGETNRTAVISPFLFQGIQWTTKPIAQRIAVLRMER